MARNETLFEEEIVCVKKLFVDHGIEAKCRCPRCTDRGKRMPKKCDIFAPELLANATKDVEDETKRG